MKHMGKDRKDFTMRIILASKSPRRKELLSKLGYDFITYNINVDETIDSYDSYVEFVEKTVLKKAQFAKNDFPNDIVICADTIVVCENKILGKPHNKEEAYKMISLLSGRTHLVVTSVSIVYQNNYKIITESTEVEVIQMTEEEIQGYINTPEPYDKAGGYAIQGIFSKYISRINGDYYTVVGLPLCRLNQELKKIINQQ